MLHQSKRIFAALSSSALLSTSASADLLIHEAFDYTPTDPLNDGVFLGDGNQSGGLGLGPWRQVNSGSNEFEVITPGLTFTDGGGNELPSAGGYAVRTNRVGQAAVSSDVDPGATAALTADNSTMWMSFLFVDRGFSGPTSALMLASEDMVFGDAHNLSAPGYGVGIVIRATVNPQRAIHTAYYNGTTSYTRKAEAVPTFLSTGGPENTVFLLAAKINWKPDGQLDEIHVFNITDLSAEPDEADALASDTFDMSLVNQQALDVLNIGETQVDGFDEIRIANTFEEVVGGSALRLVSTTVDAGGGRSIGGSFTLTSTIGQADAFATFTSGAFGLGGGFWGSGGGTTPSGYGAWAATNIAPGLDMSFEGDADGDGMPNGLDYVLDGTGFQILGERLLTAPPAGIPADVDFVLEASTDLDNDWVTLLEYQGGVQTYLDPDLIIDYLAGTATDQRLPDRQFYRYRATLLP